MNRYQIVITPALTGPEYAGLFCKVVDTDRNNDVVCYCHNEAQAVPVALALNHYDYAITHIEGA